MLIVWMASLSRIKHMPRIGGFRRRSGRTFYGQIFPLFIISILSGYGVGVFHRESFLENPGTPPQLPRRVSKWKSKTISISTWTFDGHWGLGIPDIRDIGVFPRCFTKFAEYSDKNIYDYSKRVWICSLLCKRPRSYHSTGKTHVKDKIF